MDLVDDQSVSGEDVTVLEPASGNAGGDDDDVPCWSLWSRLTLSVDDADLEIGGSKNRLGDRPYRQCLPCSGPGNDTEAFAGTGKLPDLAAVLFLENCRNVKAERQLDRFAGSTSGRDDDQSAGRRLCSHERLTIRRKVSVGYDALHARWKNAYIAPDAKRPQGLSSSGAVAMTSRDLVSVFPTFTLTVIFLFRIVVIVVAVATGCGTDVHAIAKLIISIVGIVVPTTALIVVIGAVVTVVAVALLSLPHLLLPPLLSLLPLLVVVVRNATVQNGEGAVGITARTLNDQVAVIVGDATLVDRAAAITDLIPCAVVT